VIPTVNASSFRLQYFPYFVWCSKHSCLFSVSIQYSPGMASKFFLQPLIIIPVAPLITSKILHFIFYIRYISIQKLSNLFTYLFTYLLTPWCRVLLEKLTGLQLVKKFPAFYGTWWFITAFTSTS
jgi:hypothetical protein